MATAVGDILRLAVRFQFDSLHDIVNVWHVVLNERPAPLLDSAVMDDISATLEIWYNQMASYLTTSVAGADISGVNVTKDELLPVVPFGAAGTNAGEGLPLMDSPMIQWGSATPRHGSRIFLPPINEATQNDGVLVSAVVSTLEDMAADVIAGFAAGAAGVAFDRVAWDRSAGLARALVSAFVPVGLRTQRRRRQGVGS